MKSWKTTLGGVASVMAGLAAAITLYQQGNITEAIATLLGALGCGYGLISARDNNVPSVAIPKALEAQEKISRETTMFKKDV